MSGNETITGFNGDDDLRDPALRRALDHAPDSEATPDPRTRDAIRKMAHNLAAASVSTAGSAAANSASASPWWRRLLGGGEPRSRMPWNAAFATVLVATFVTVLWHREPIPDAQLDGEARVTAGAPAPAQAPIQQPSAEAAPQLDQAATAAAPEPAPPSLATQPAAPARDEAQRDNARSKEAANANAADAVRGPGAAQSYAKQAPRAASEGDKKSVETQAAAAEPMQAAPAPAPAPAAAAPSPLSAAEQSTPMRDERLERDVDSERRRAYGAAAPAAPAASVIPPPTFELQRSPLPSPAAAPPAITARRETQDSNASSAGGRPDAEASGALRQGAQRATSKIAKPSAGPSFAALDQWTSFDFARSGPAVRHTRGDIEGLAALVNTVARSAVSPDEPLTVPVDMRLTFHRGDALIAVLEVAGDQVRWTPQPGGTATVGTPSAQALAALRSLLTR